MHHRQNPAKRRLREKSHERAWADRQNAPNRLCFATYCASALKFQQVADRETACELGAWSRSASNACRDRVPFSPAAKLPDRRVANDRPGIVALSDQRGSSIARERISLS